MNVEESRLGADLPAAAPLRRGIRVPSWRAMRPEIVVPAVLAIVLGMLTLGRKPWSFDEGYDVVLARDNWFKYLLKTGYYEPSQALYLVVFKVWRAVSPESEWFTRLPSVVAAALAAALVAVLAARLFTRTTGIVAGTLFATNATVVAFSQQTRTYALATLAAIVTTILFLRALESDERRRWLVYGIAGALGAYAHFFVGFVVASHGILLPRMSSSQRSRLLQSWALIAIAFLPAAPYVVIGGHGGVDWIPPTSWPRLRGAVSTVAGFNIVLLVAAVAGAIVSISPRAAGARRWVGALLAAWAVVPLAGALVVSLAKPVLVGRYLIVAAPALAILAAVALTTIRPRYLAAAGAIAIAVLSAREINKWYRSIPEDWRGAAHYAAARVRHGSTVVVYPTGVVDSYSLYAPLPAACRRIPGHLEPRCAFAAKGRETLVVTPLPEEWRRIPGSEHYVFASQKRFGNWLRVVRLERRVRRSDRRPRDALLDRLADNSHYVRRRRDSPPRDSSNVATAERSIARHAWL